jgi:20S proteasome alpha/beta subunit
LTLIIGARCVDGIVIGSDRKIQRGGETSYENKIFEFDVGGKILFAAEGLTGIRDDFFYLLESAITSRRVIDTLYEVKLLVEDIIANLSERYGERVRDPSPVGVLMGGLEQLKGGSAIVYYIHGVGYGEQVSFRCSGHGGQYAYSIAKFLCGPNICENLDTNEVARRIAYIISWVSEDVDSTVGGLPSIAIMKNGQPTVNYLADEILKEIQAKVGNHKLDLPKLFELHTKES